MLIEELAVVDGPSKLILLTLSVNHTHLHTSRDLETWRLEKHLNARHLAMRSSKLSSLIPFQ